MVPGEAAYTGVLRALDELRDSSQDAQAFYAEQLTHLSRLQGELEERCEWVCAEENRLAGERESWEQQASAERDALRVREATCTAENVAFNERQAAWEAERERLQRELQEAREAAQRAVDPTEFTTRISQLEQERLTLLSERRRAREQAEQLTQVSARLAATQATLCTVQEQAARERIGFETQQAQLEQERRAAEQRSAEELAALQAGWDARWEEEANQRRVLEAQLAASNAAVSAAALRAEETADSSSSAERQALEAELEEVRRRAAELAEGVQSERLRMASEREAWEQELCTLRKLVEAQVTMSSLVSSTSAVGAGAREVPSLAAGTGGGAGALPVSAADHAVLDHVMAQFESLQKDRQRRRANHRGGKQEVA